MNNKIDIPQGWEIKKLGEVCDELVRGPFGSSLKKEFFVKPSIDTYKVYEQKNAIQGNCNIGTYYITNEKFKELVRFECKHGDIIMSCSGTIGKLYTIPNGAPKGIINQALLKISLNSSINEYIFKLVFANKIQSLSMAGSGIQNIASVKYIKNINIMLPPLEEQKKIADILLTWDKAITTLKEIIQQKELQKKGLMQNLLTGKKRLDGFNDEWKEVKLGEIAEIKSGYSFRTTSFSHSGIALIRISNIICNKIEINNNTVFLPNNYKDLYDNFIIKNNDLLIAMSGATTGKMGVYRTNNIALLNQRVGCIRAKINYSQDFIIQALSNFDYIFLNMSYGGAQENISIKDISNAKLFIPTSIEEQKAIAEILMKADEEISLLNKQLELYTEQKKGLMQQLLTGKIRVN